VQEDFVMNSVNKVANFNGQRPVIDPGDAVLLLIDHQSGLFQTVKDMEMTVLRANVTTLAKVATLAKIQQTWSRPDAAQWAEAYSALFPPYQLLIESYSKAQEVVTQHEQLDSVLA
jgi:nicotinamidase-related amidase